MIFDRGQRLVLAVIREEANLIKPDTGQNECAIAAFSFGLTLIQAQYFNDLLKELIQLGRPYNSGVLAGGAHFEYQKAPPEIVAKVERTKDIAQRHQVPIKTVPICLDDTPPRRRQLLSRKN